MRSMNALTWRNLTAHKLRSVLTALAITLGVAMVLAASIVGQAAGQSAAELSEEGPCVDLEVFSRDGAPFDTAVLDTLRASPDVEQVSPSLRVEVEGVDPEIAELTLLGVDPEVYHALHEPKLAGGAFLDEPNTIVLPMMVAIENGLNVGDPIVLKSGERQVTLTVAGRLRLEQDIAALGEVNVAYVPLEVAQALRPSSGQALGDTPGQIDQVELVLHPGADADPVKASLAQRVGEELVVVKASAGGRELGAALVQGGLVMAGAIILFAAGFVIMNAFAMSVTARTREIGALRALGMTRRQVWWLVLSEAGLLGLSGAVLGVPTGVGLAWGVIRVLGTLDDVALSVPWWGASLSLLLGLGVTLIGALQPAQQASRVSPLVAVRSHGAKGNAGWYVRYGGRVGGILLLILLPAVTAIVLILHPDFIVSFAIIGVAQVGLLLSTTLLLPSLINPVVELARPYLVRWLGAAGRLAADNLGRNRLRAVLTAGALTAALTTIVATSGLMTATFKGGLGTYFSLFNEDGMVMPDIGALLASGELSLENSYEKLTTGAILDPALVQAVESLAKSGLFEMERVGFAPIPTELGPVPGSPGVFVEPEIFLRLGNFDFFEGDAETALEWMERGRAVLLVPITAEKLGVGVGDTIPMDTLQGEIEFTVAGIGGIGYNFTAFSYADGKAYFGLVGPSWLGIIVPEGEDVDAAIAQVQTAIKPYEGISVGKMTPEALEGTWFKIFDQAQMLLDALLLLAVIVAALGVVNTMVINVAERRREIALMRAVGATQRQVRQSVVAEAATLGLMAALVATALGLTTLLLMTVVLSSGGGAESVGFRVSWELAASALPPALRDLGLAAALSLVFGPLVAALAAYYPARQAAATDVVEATRSERVTLKRTERVRETRFFPKNLVSSLNFLAWRNLEQHRLRTVLSALAVALGVAVTVAASVTSEAILNALSESKDAQAFMTGLLDQLGSILTLAGVGITFAAGFLVFNAFAMSVTQQSRQIGTLRSLGMTRRQVMRLVLVEALLVGGLGTLVGLVGGPLLGKGVIALMKALLSEGLFVFSASEASASSLLLATALGGGVTLLSALIPAWLATRVSPLVALRAEATGGIAHTPVGRTLVAGLVVVGLAMYLVVAPPGEWVEYPWDVILAAAFTLVWLGCLALILPAFIGGVGHWARGPLTRVWGATGRMVADNLQRGRGRVTLTILTLALGLTMIVGMTGFISFTADELMGPSLTGIERLRLFIVAPFDVSAGMSAYSGLDTIELPPELVAEVSRGVEGRAWAADEWRFTIVPELSFFGSSYFSFVTDPHDVKRSGDVFFSFTEGNWETAIPIMEKGCGVLVTPMVANRNGVSVGETFDVTGADGPVACTIAGIGRTYVNSSIIGLAAQDEFAVTKPFMLQVIPLPGVDRADLKADLVALVERYPDAHLIEPEGMYEAQLRAIDAMPDMLNALLLLAVVAAALGVVNTTMMSVAERRRELGLLRAVGATRRQMVAVVTGEAALMGLIGGGLGMVAGTGVVVILAVTYGGNSWGVPDLDLWGAAWRSAQPALFNGLVGLIAAPFICAGAAWLPVRSLLRGSAIETMEPGRNRVFRKNPGFLPTLNFLAWRNLEQHRLRAVLSTLAVALGAAMIVAASVASEGVRSGVQASDVSRDATAWLTDTLELGLNTVGFVILVAAGFVIFNAFAMAITQRQRQIGVLRSLGMTRRQVMRLVLVEALITGGMGTLLGLLTGPLLGSAILTLMRFAHLDIGQGSVSFTSIVLAILMGVGITLLSVLIPARRATHISPLVAMRQVTASGVEHIPLVRGALGLLIITGLTVYLIIAPPGEWTLPPWDIRMPLMLATLWMTALLLITPALIGVVGQATRRPLTRLAGATGRLITDNLRRGRRRVTLTILTFAVGLTVIASITGIFTFTSKVLIGHLAEGALQQSGLLVVPFDPSHTILAEIDKLNLETLALEPEVMEDFYNLLEGRAEVGEGFAVIAPEIGAVMSSYPSFIYDLDILTRPRFYAFAEGNWETALPTMEAGCGVLISPGVAARNQVGIGDTITLQGVTGPIDCAVAGIGAGGYHPASFISPAAKYAFDTQNPAALIIFPLPGIDREALEADMQALVERHGTNALVIEPQEAIELLFSDGSDMLISLLNSLLLLAVLAAAIGVVNTTVMSVAERQRELGLLRAVGATRAQVNAVVAGEAALMGLIGGGLGLVAGAGISVIFPVSFGGNSFGVVDLPLWEAAWQSTQPALLTGLFGLIVAPLISASAAWLSVRSILRGSAIEMMEPGRNQVFAAALTKKPGFFGGSIRARFVLGTAILMAVVLAGLIGVVTTHARTRIEEQMHDALRTMVTWNAGMVELGLPDDAETLDFDSLQAGQMFDFDSDALLRFERLMDGLTEQGLDDFTIADRDNVVLIGLDTREIGTLAPELETTDEAAVYSEREGGEWLMHASAPVRNDDGLLVGSVRLTIDAREVQGFLNSLRNTLAAIGAVIVFIGLVISWWLVTPLARATRQLAAHAARVGRGEYTLFPHTPKLPHARLSLRTKMTIAMVLILVLMVSVLELVTIPIERRHVEDTLKDSLVAAAEWIGQVASESFDMEPSELAPVGPETGFFGKNPVSLDLLARLQELSDQMRSDDMAYTALVNEEGTIILSDQLALIGEEVAVPSGTQIEETTWRDEEVWVASTPLQRGQDGEQIGALRMAVRRNRVEVFLDESRNLFHLTGLIAVLAGVLLAQVIGGAVTAPVRQLAAGTRRIAQGDLSVQFRVDTADLGGRGDELAILANAYNRMVVGLQEREWLRDMFGRFVSREVAEAIRTGQVRLEGENRVVSILFCGIRDFTARSERSTPEEMVALLNEYLPVVVEAAQRHEGTVNKFGGDSMLVIYGAPRRLQESAYLAVLTALEMRANLEQLNEALAERGEAPIRIGVGINTGIALAGAVGPPERQEYTVIGDAVNLASRIEALNKAYPNYDILISGWTCKALGSRRAEFEFADLGEVQIRGKVEPVRVWAVVKKIANHNEGYYPGAT